jgi:hypothetical protein
MPTAFNLEEITGVDKGIKEEDVEFIPVKSRFKAALRRIAFFIVSSSIAEEIHPPPPHAYYYASP